MPSVGGRVPDGFPAPAQWLVSLSLPRNHSVGASASAPVTPRHPEFMGSTPTAPPGSLSRPCSCWAVVSWALARMA